MLGVSQTLGKCSFSFDIFLTDFVVVVFFASTCPRKAGGCGQKSAGPAQHLNSSFVLKFGCPPSMGVYMLSASQVHR